MQVTLRKAANINSEILKKVSALHVSAPQMGRVEVNPVTSPAAQLQKMVEDFETKQELISQLNEIYWAIRQRIAAVNSSSGITDLLTRDTFLSSEIKRLEQFTMTAVAPSPEAFEAKFTMALSRAQKSENTYFSERDREISVSVVTQQFVNDAAAKMLSMKRTRNEISDAILSANVSNFVEIPAEEWATLTAVGVV